MRLFSRLAAGVAVAMSVAIFAPAQAQTSDRTVVRSPVLTVNQDALFERSAYGQRLQAELETASAALAAENRIIEADLSEEERQLTEARATMEPEAFSALAVAFDTKVVELRRVQDQKERDLLRRPDEARQEFLRAALPALAQIVRERGAVAILDARAVLLSADLIDITEDAISRIDQILGDGSGVAPPQAAPAGVEPEDPPAPGSPADLPAPPDLETPPVTQP